MIAAQLPDGLSLRPACPSDQPFIARVYRHARPDLQWIDGEPDLLQTVLKQQFQVLQQGAGETYPEAMQFIIEKIRTPVGVVMVDFGEGEVRLIFLGLIPQVRGQGYGRGVLVALQQAARKVHCPLAVIVWHHTTLARQLYLAAGFELAGTGDMADKLVWRPESRDTPVS